MAAPGARPPTLARWALRVAREGRAPFGANVLPDGPSPPDAAWVQARRQQQALRALGLHVVPVWRLPSRFVALAAPPLCLFVRGNASLLGRVAVAVVGARRASPGPLAWTRAVAAHWARAGALLVSGGAMGIDAAAHRGALDAGGATLAYIGTPVDRIYPAINAPLFRDVLAAGGALVSEHPPLAPSFKGHHAARNRFIAGHASLLLVAEARLRSGTLSAVGHARRCGTAVRWAPEAVGGAREGLLALQAAGTGEAYGHADEAAIFAALHAALHGAPNATDPPRGQA